LDHAAMIQQPSPAVQSVMTAALCIRESFDALRCRSVTQRRRSMAPAAMSNSSDRTRRRDEWSGRIGAIAASHDRTAFAELFAFYAPRVKGYLQRTGTSEAQAEDLAQETMLAVWRKAGLYDPGNASAATWIFTIARNLRIDALRRERRGGAIQVEEVEAEYEVDAAPLADARFLTAEAEARVRRALKSLPSDQLRVIEMSFFEEQPHGEIARAADSSWHREIPREAGDAAPARPSG
jgi:RNA polymerase sigma-70 factor, ECF subfamily